MATPTSPIDTTKPVVLFDGVCTLCNTSVDFIIRHERTSTHLFASLQSQYASQLLSKHGVTVNAEPESIIVVKGNSIFDKSDAALEIAKHLNFPWNLTRLARIVPKSFRDKVYDLVAKNRYKWFGKKETCRIPTPEERSRFLGVLALLIPLLVMSTSAQTLEITEEFEQEVKQSALHAHYTSQLLDSAQLVDCIKRVHMIATGSGSGWHNDTENRITTIGDYSASPITDEHEPVRLLGFTCNHNGVGGFIEVDGWFSDSQGRRSRALLYFYKGIVRNGINTDLGNSRGKTGGGMALESLINGVITVNDFAWYVELNEAGDSWDPVDGMDNYSDTIFGYYDNGQIWFPVVPTPVGDRNKPRKRNLLLDFNRDGSADTLAMYESHSYANWEAQVILSGGTDTIDLPHLMYSSVEHDSLSYYGEQFPVVEQSDSTLIITYITEREAKQTISYGFVWNETLQSWLYDPALTQGKIVGNNPGFTRIEEFDATWTLSPF